jgi:uncharacterized protein YkwD
VTKVAQGLGAVCRSNVVLRTAPRPRALFAALALAVALLAGCLPPEEQSFLDRTNQLRASTGVAALAVHPSLNAKAQDWAEHMAATDHLYHSTLSDGLGDVRWTTLGENVGRSSRNGDWVLKLHDKLVSSPGHYRNLVDGRFTHMGVGVATAANGDVYVAEVFAAIP